MAIVKEFRCPGHGVFESTDPVCPRGCTAGVSRAFLTPVGISTGGRSKSIDRTIEQLAKDFGVSDFNNHGGTTAARVRSPQESMMEAHQQAIRKRFGDSPWKPMASGPASVTGTMAQYGAPPPTDMSILKDPGIPRKPVIHTRHTEDAALLAKVKAA